MTASELHMFTNGMCASSVVTPTAIKVSESMNPFELHAFLLGSRYVTRVETPEHTAFIDETGHIYVLRRGSVAYTDGI